MPRRNRYERSSYSEPVPIRDDTYWIVKFVDEGEIDIMLKMMKYEYRRGVFSLLVVITALAAAELLFVIGIFAEKNLLAGLGITFLVLGGWASFMFVLIYGVIIYSQDLKNKTGYMVFMTPLSNYKIIGAKLLSILLTGATLVAFLGLLIVVDYNLLKSHNGGVAGAEFVLDEILGTRGLSIGSVIANVAGFIVVALIQFYTMITIAYLAVSLSSTVLQNKKIKGVVSFILFVALYAMVSYIAYKLPHLGKNVQVETMLDAMYKNIPQLILYVACMIGSYIGSATLLTKKISL